MKKLCSRYCGPVSCSYKNKVIELKSASASNKNIHRNNPKEKYMEVEMDVHKYKKDHQNSLSQSEGIKKEVNAHINSLRKK